MEKQLKNELNIIKDESFDNTTVNIDNKQFVNCIFNKCTFVYSGTGQVAFKECKFNGVKWTFSSYASNTIEFMRNIYHGFGEVGEKLIEGTFNKIRESATHTYVNGEKKSIDELLDELPPEIDGYTRRIMTLDNFVVIEYSKRQLFFRYLHPDKATEEMITENLLFDAPGTTFSEAYKKITKKIRDYEESR